MKKQKGQVTIAKNIKRQAQVTWRGKVYYGETSMEALRNAKNGKNN